jgi:hypothetical protein
MEAMKKYTFMVGTGTQARIIITVQAPTPEAARAQAYAALLAKSGRQKPIGA